MARGLAWLHHGKLACFAHTERAVTFLPLRVLCGYACTPGCMLLALLHTCTPRAARVRRAAALTGHAARSTALTANTLGPAGSSAAKGGDHGPRAARKHGASHVKPVHGLAGDRKSKNVRPPCSALLHTAACRPADLKSPSTRLQPKSGDAKKKGGGGKFTWGAVLSEPTDGPQALDKNDPNYDSDEDAVLREAALPEDGEGGGAHQHGLYHSGSRIVQAVDDLKAEVRSAWYCAPARAAARRASADTTRLRCCLLLGAVAHRCT